MELTTQEYIKQPPEEIFNFSSAMTDDEWHSYETHSQEYTSIVMKTKQTHI